MSSASQRAESLDNRLPSEHEMRSANQLRQILASLMDSGDDVRLKMLDEQKQSADIVLSRPLSELLIDLLRAVGGGDAVMVMPLAKQLTTQEAADVLNVSRPHLIKLLEQGAMAYETVGRHRRVLAKDVFKFKEAQIKERDAALTELAQSDADLL